MAEPALHHLSATELAGRITRRELSAREYLEHIASRVEAHNQAVNAVVTLDLERASEAALAADEATAAGRSSGPLHGLAMTGPVVISPPFPHTQAGSAIDRTVEIDGVTRPFLDLTWWTMLIGGAYLPATVVPVGFTTDGRPLAVQIVGPHLEDRTALAVARALRSALGPMSFPEVPRTPVP